MMHFHQPRPIGKTEKKKRKIARAKLFGNTRKSEGNSTRITTSHNSNSTSCAYAQLPTNWSFFDFSILWFFDASSYMSISDSKRLRAFLFLRLKKNLCKKARTYNSYFQTKRKKTNGIVIC